MEDLTVKGKIIKASILLAIVLLMMLTVTACSGAKPPDEESISIEVKSALQGILPSSRTIDEIEVLETETDDEAGLHMVLVKVNSSDKEIAYLEYYAFLYARNDDKEWDMVDHRSERTNLWTKTPLVGVDESLFRSAIMGMNFTIDGDDWNISDDSLDRVTVSNRNTQLEQKRDSVVLDVVLSSLALTATGQIELAYYFDSSWIFENNNITTPFTSEVKPNAVFNMTDDLLIGKIIELRQFDFSSGNTAQSVSLNREQISNIAVVQENTSNMGTHKTFEHKFDLEKELVTFKIIADSVYNFDGNSWSLQDFQISPTVTDVRLDGTVWGGIYEHSRWRLGSYWFDDLIGTGVREFLLEISVIPAINGMRAILTELSVPIYSQNLFGSAVNFDDLSFSLKFEEWIIEANWTNNRGRSSNQINRDSDVTFNGFINVDDSTIKRTSGGNHFEIMIQQEAPPPVDDDIEDDDEDNEEDDD